MKTRIALIVLLTALLSVGITRSLQAANTDGRIESSARKTYVYKTYLKDDSIHIDAKDGVVTLSGTVAEASHKSLAEDTVKGLPGVKSIVNNLEVKAPPPAPQSDDWISAKVKAALLFHRSVSSKTQVFVKDGIVTLKGTATNQAQKDLTTEYAKDVEGVKDVRNELMVEAAAKPEPTMSEKIDDGSITAQVKMALLTHRSTSALRTDVETENGVVILRGTAKNQAEKDLATKLVSDIQGVKDVKNEMTIGGG